ncbi:unnamed protein product [Blepharisma stoltei]|uniref:Uncharacterized protein n=1 Tax=Blepharisma stoltei TaxID=1481888 RepID=A0AAU9JL08_9CILI|nr:unnamed protein product [Blepharisma stoltei]
MLLFSLKRAFNYLSFASKRFNISRTSRFYTTKSSSPNKNWRIAEPYLNLGQITEICQKFKKNEIGVEELEKAFAKASHLTFQGIYDELAKFISTVMRENFTRHSSKNVLKVFEEAVAKSLKHYTDNRDIEICLGNILSMHKIAAIPKNENIEDELLNYLSRNRSYLRVKKLHSITRLIEAPVNVEKYKEIYKTLAKNINRSDLENLKSHNFFLLSNAFTFANSYVHGGLSLKTEEGENLLEVIQKIFESRFLNGELNASEACIYFRSFLLDNNQYRELSQEIGCFLIQKIKSIEDSYFASFLFCIGKLPEFQSENDLVHKIIYENFLERFPKMTSINLTLSIKQFNEQTCYIDDRLIQLIKEKIDTTEFSNLKLLEKIDLCLELISILWNNYENYDTELLERLKNILFENYDEANNVQKTKIALFCSISKDYNEKFWRSFLDETIILSSYEINWNYLYLIHVSLYDSPYLYEFLNKIEPYIDDINASWRWARDRDLRKSNSTSAHTLISDYLFTNLIRKCILSKRIDIVRDYYCNFYFDFSIPLSKKLIKINRFSDYVLPARFLKRFNTASNKSLEMKGWEILNIGPFDSDEEIIGKLDKLIANK